MRIGYLECFAGISGDMLMGALVDAGAPIEVITRAVSSLGLGAELKISKVNRSGIQGTKVDVMVQGKLEEAAAISGAHEHADRDEREAGHDRGRQHAHDRHAHPHPHRNLSTIRRILLEAPLSQRAQGLSLTAFELLAEAEARVHGISVEEVRFHEVGAIDAIVDIVCTAVAVDTLDLERWYCSAVNVGGGFVNCAHGRFPVPAPATAELLKNLPVYSTGPQMELATPTGAALLRALNVRFDALGVMRADSIGYGAGARDSEGFPNVLRFTIGQMAEEEELHQEQKFHQEKVTVLECAIDDMNPEVIAHAMHLAAERGALDTMSSPVMMKKGRLGSLLTVLCRSRDSSDLQELLFRETSTLGMRVREETRVFLLRESVPVETEFGVIRVKIGSWREEVLNAAPEFEDCRRAAEALNVPIKTVMQSALAQWRRESAAKSAS